MPVRSLVGGQAFLCVFFELTKYNIVLKQRAFSSLAAPFSTDERTFAE
jgi:hypothetical protein